MMRKNTIRFLHLSDFHTGKDSYGQRMLFKYILEHVRSRVQEDRGPNLVFITGDIADKGLEQQYEQFSQLFLCPLVDIPGINLTQDIILLPGNHDVDREEARFVKMHEVLSQDKAVLDPDESGQSKRKQFWDRFKKFVTFDSRNQDPDSHWVFSSPGVTVKFCAFGGDSIGILNVNTAWLSYDKNDRHELSPGKGMVEAGLDELQHADVKLVLGHHPLDWLLDDVARQLKVLFARHKVIYLHGHLHRNEGRGEVVGGEGFLTLQAGAGFQERENDDWQNGFQWYEIDLEQNILLVEPLIWSASHQEFHIDSNAFPNAYKSLQVADRWQFALPGRLQESAWERGSGMSLLRPERSIIVQSDEAAQIDKVTDNYVSYIRSRCIGKRIIDRSEVQEVAEKLSDRQSATAMLVLGRSGYGKSAVLSGVAERMKAEGWRVLAFSLDRPTLAETPQGVGWQLDLPGSPVDVLTRIAEGGDALFILDQLDSASRTSGRNPGAMDCIAQMLRQASKVPRTRVLMACRESDYRDDNRLKDLIQGATQTHELNLPAFDEETVKPVVRSLGINPDLLSQAQLRLLSIPVHIRLLEMVLAVNPSTKLDFRTSKELYDKFWDEKRLAIQNRLGREIRWPDIVERLIDHMHESQTLMVPQEVLDDFGQDVDVMESEGVISLEDHYYRFFHESFFDYAFARRFVGRNRSISELFQSRGDEMFRRSQIKYLLSYERTAYKELYRSNLKEALEASGSRALMREAILDFLRELDDPSPEEWRIIDRGIRGSGNEIDPNFVQGILKVAYGSTPWFRLLLGNGLITKWLRADRPDIVNLALNLMQGVQKEVPEPVTEMLEPFEAVSGEWQQRIIDFMSGSEFGACRRFFELFLRLLNMGALDHILAGRRDHHFLWSLVWNVSKARPDWAAELIAAYVRHQDQLCAEGGRTDPFSGDPPYIPDEEWGHDLILDCAGRAPQAFLAHLLPVIQSIIERNLSNDEESPFRDRVWDHREFGKTYDMSGALLRGIEHAICNLSTSSLETIESLLQELRESNYETLHYLLIRAYAANGQRFADQAADYLLQSSTRFRIGYVGDEYWAVRELLEATTPHCSDDRIARLEESILQYELPLGGRYRDRRLARDWARLSLLQGISRNRLSGRALDRLQGMENEFADDPPKPPPKRATSAVISPISKSAAAIMTDEQWLRAMQKYRLEDIGQRTEQGWIGGAYQLSQVLADQTKKDPGRFARLLLDFPSDLNRLYFEAVLRGIAGKEIETDMLDKVLERCHSFPRHPLGWGICYVLERTKDPDLSDETLVLAAWYAVNDSDPSDGDQIGPPESMLTEGFNSVRGSAAIAMGNLIQVQGSRADLFSETLAHMVRDPSIAVRACVAFTLCASYLHDPRSAVELFADLCEAPDALLATQYVRKFIRMALPDFFSDLEAIIRRMMASSEPGVATAAAYDITGISFRSEDALALASECAAGSDPLRIGAAQLYAEGIGIPLARPRSEQALRNFFFDSRIEVREAAAACFHHLPEGQVQQFRGLIQFFVSSPSFADFHSSLIQNLGRVKGPLPDVVLDVATAFLDCVGTLAADLRTRTGGDGYVLQSLVFRIRREASEASVRQQCDALINRMLQLGIYGVKKNLQRLDEDNRS